MRLVVAGLMILCKKKLSRIQFIYFFCSYLDTLFFLLTPRFNEVTGNIFLRFLNRFNGFSHFSRPKNR